MIDLTLLVRGLLYPSIDPLEATEHVSAPNLELLLTRAESSAVSVAGYESLLLQQFDLKLPANRDVPFAAITHLIDFDDSHDGVWMRADPVHLRPDLDKLILFDCASFELARAEADALTDQVNQALGSSDWRLMVGREPTRWYLRLMDLPRVMTRPPSEVVGRNIDRYLPTGPDGKVWHRLVNDVQMILHGSEVNRARQARGQPPINSVWFWGVGARPQRLSARWSAVWTNGPVGLGLARLCNTPCAEVPGAAVEWFRMLDTEGELLVDLGVHLEGVRKAGIQGWRDYLTGLEQSWFLPLRSMLKTRRIRSLTLCTETRRFTVSRSRLSRFWIRRKDIRSHLEGRG